MTDLASTAGVKSEASQARILGSWPVAAAIVIAAMAQQAIGHIDGDDSWFITFAEKILDGARAYVDVSDPNPPAGFLAYMPAVIAARWCGLRAEAGVVVEILLAVLASLALSGAIMRRAHLIGDDEVGLWRNAALWIFLFAAGFGFAEREHFAVLACLPLLAAMSARGAHGAASAPQAVAAGVCGGVALAFKPYYALPLAAAALVACLRRRSLAPLAAPENFIAVATFVAYLALVRFAYPDYVTQVLPLAVEVYAPARHAMSEVLVSPPFLFNLALIAAFSGASRILGADWRATALAVASAGFLAAYVIQAKIWFNHAYPGIALGALACVVLATGRRAAAPEAAACFARLCVAPALVCAPFFAAVTINLTGAEEYPGLTAAVRANAPTHPKIAALAQQLDVGHPLTRRLDGTWIGTQNALWIDNCVRQILVATHVAGVARERLLGYAQAERTQLAADLAKGSPDVVLVESAALRKWAESKAEFAGLLDGFVRKAQVGDIEVWARVAP